jgi:hypothetical protein
MACQSFFSLDKSPDERAALCHSLDRAVFMGEAAMPLVLGSGQPFDTLASHVENRRGRLCLSRFLLLVLFAGLMGLAPLAHASPPDPVWNPGFYDDADHDDVIVFLTNMGAVLDRLPEGIGCLRFVVGYLLSLLGSAPSDDSVLAFHLRSPPTA